MQCNADDHNDTMPLKGFSTTLLQGFSTTLLQGLSQSYYTSMWEGGEAHLQIAFFAMEMTNHH